jgi:hypothetical protein
MSNLWCLIRISDFAVRFVSRLRLRCLLFANTLALATPRMNVSLYAGWNLDWVSTRVFGVGTGDSRL